MRQLIMCALVAITLANSGCVSTYYARDLASVPIGITKSEFVRTFSHDRIVGPVPRASSQTPDGLLEVLTMPIRASGTAPEEEYWFLFRNGTLVQFGKPDDWQSIAARYAIDFNPKPSVVRAPSSP